MFKNLSYFVRQGHRESNLYVQRYFVTKNKMFQMFQRNVFFYNCFRILIGKVCTSEKKMIVLFLKTLFYVSRGTFSEKNFESKNFFFVKYYRALRQKISDFGEIVSGKFVIIPFYFCRGRFQGKFSWKKRVFSLFPGLEQKNRLLIEDQDECETIILCVRWIFLRNNIFLKIFDIFFHVFRAKICNFWKNFRRVVKIALYISRGTSWWNYFGSLKTFLLKVFGPRVKTFSLILSAWPLKLPPTSPEVLSINFFLIL